MLTIKVYSVDRRTGERRTVRPERTLTGHDSHVFELSMALPPCRCPLHRQQSSREHGVGQ